MTLSQTSAALSELTLGPSVPARRLRPIAVRRPAGASGAVVFARRRWHGRSACTSAAAPAERRTEPLDLIVSKEDAGLCSFFGSPAMPVTMSCTETVHDTKEITPVPSIPSASPDTPNNEQALIGKTVQVEGEIFSKQDLYVDGVVKGTIEMSENKLTIGLNGRVQADIKARELIVLGSVQGDVKAIDRLEACKNARLVGDFKADRIIIDDGVYIKGNIETVKVGVSAANKAAVRDIGSARQG